MLRLVKDKQKVNNFLFKQFIHKVDVVAGALASIMFNYQNV